MMSHTTFPWRIGGTQGNGICRWSVWLLGAVLPGAIAIAHNADGLPIENRAFEQKREPTTDDTPGVLKGGAYHWRDVNVTERSYRCVGKQYGGATVETVRHSVEYPYVVHDFFGTFRGAAGRLMARKPAMEADIVSGTVEELDEYRWRFVDWSGTDQKVQGVICVALIPKKEGGFGGILGWYQRSGSEIRTVMIFFDNLDGVPAQLIDEFLKQYPSSVREEDFHGKTWVADDVRKWVRLVELLREDRDRFGFALSRLAAYDDKVFGLDRTKLDPADPVTFKQAIYDLTERTEQWLGEREKTRRSRGDE